jgi:hypothetical protein
MGTTFLLRTHAAPHSETTQSLFKLLGLTSNHNSREQLIAFLISSANPGPVLDPSQTETLVHRLF